MDKLSDEKVARWVEKRRHREQLRQHLRARPHDPKSRLAQRIRRPATAPKASGDPARRSTDPAAGATKPACSAHCHVRASSCCRSDSRHGRCLASISRDVRKTQCQVAAHGERIVADIDLLRAQLIARLASIQTSLNALAGTPITARDVLTAPNGVYVISQPGHYSFAENIILPGPIGPYNLVIEIAANDVVLDLGSFVFEQQGSTAATALYGIYIAGPEGTGASNVTVQNGTIRGFANAIAVASGSDLTVLQRLRVLEVGLDPSFFETFFETNVVTAFFVSNLIVRECVFDQVRGVGLYLSSVQGLVVEDVLMTNFIPRMVNVSGDIYVNIVGVDLIEFADTTVSNDLTFRRLIFEQFDAEAPAGAPPPYSVGVYGMIFDTPTLGVVQHNILIEDVLCRHFTAVGGLTTVLYGILGYGAYSKESPEVLSGPVGNVLRRVVVQQLAGATPVLPKSTMTVFEAAGIDWEGQQDLIEDCVVQNLVYTGAANPSINAFCLGVGVFFHGHGCRLRRCSVTGIDLTRFGKNSNPDATGFQTCTCGVVGALIEENYAGDNVADPSSDTAGGFGILSSIDTVVRNNVAASNNYSGFAAFDTSVPSANNLYQSNTVTGSTTWGFADFTADSNSAYIDNFARSAQFNYTSPAGRPVLFGAQIVQWAIPAPAPTANITKLTNLSVSP